MTKNHMTYKHKKFLFEQINKKDIIDEEMGNDRFVALTNDTVYFVSIGISSGHFFGKKVKSFPIPTITSVDIGKKILASYMEITAAGMGGSASAGAGYSEFNENRVFFSNDQLKRFQEIAEKIRKLMTKSKNATSGSGTADEIEKLYDLMKRGIITEKEFVSKKEKLLNL
jgi:hypothetical protein